LPPLQRSTFSSLDPARNFHGKSSQPGERSVHSMASEIQLLKFYSKTPSDETMIVHNESLRGDFENSCVMIKTPKLGTFRLTQKHSQRESFLW